MKSEKLLLELEQLIEQAGYTIRKERGTFRGDHCIVEGDKLVVVNRNRPVELQVGIMARVLQKLNMKDTYIKPAVRKELEALWKRFDKFGEKEMDELDFDQSQ